MSETKAIVECAKEIARPWSIVCYILAGLLVISVIGNVRQGLKENNIVLEQANEQSDFNTNGIVE